MDFLQNWDETELEVFLLYDQWEAGKAMNLLAGLDYWAMTSFLEGVTILDDQRFRDELSNQQQKEFIRQILKKYKRVTMPWVGSGREHDYKHTPVYFIEWALSKRFRPDWLDWAIERGLYIPKQESVLENTANSEKGTPDLFDKTSSSYPPELHLAFQAWQAVTATEGKGKPKARIKEWLEANTKLLSNEAKERIATVANWDKIGGATRTE